MFASIMSFAGMAMNPAEASMAGDAQAQEAAAPDSGTADGGGDGGGDVTARTRIVRPGLSLIL